MKSRIFQSALALLACGLAFTACSDDNEYSAATGTLLKDGSVVTGSADVTATTATLNGSVSGLDNVNPASYSTGFYYGYTENSLTGKVGASSATAFSSTLSGLDDATTIYYQAFVTLQGRVTYRGEVKSLVTTDATIATGKADGVTAYTATLKGTAGNYTEDATTGYVISTSSDVETLRSAFRIHDAVAAASREDQVTGLQPSTTYYYAAYLDLGSGILFGEVESFTTASASYDANDDFVDLGLSVKWAKANIGAAEATGKGGLFAFGDLDGWNASIDPADYAADNTYHTTSDIVYKTYGGIATLPTADQFEELFSLCAMEYVGGEAPGYQLTGPNGNTLFLPVTAKRYGYETESDDVTAYYATGSVNENNKQYYVDYEISAAGNGRNTLPVYTAVAVRAVTSAKNIALDKSLLYNTWEIDIKDDGTTTTWAGPVFFYGTDDSWHTLTNGEPIIGNSWAWEADAGNTWAWDGVDGCKGSMTIYNVDGKDSVSVTKIAKDGTSTTQKGAVTIDGENYTITSEVDLLVPTNFTDGFVTNRKNAIKIMQQGDKKLQLGFFRDADPCTLGVNYVPQLEKYGYTASLLCYGDGVIEGVDCSDAWASATMTIPGSGVGTYEITFHAVDARANGKVYVLDLQGFAAANPNVFVRVDTIKADGQEVPFDQNKFFFGDIEGNGNYRIEMANIWGAGHNDSWNGLKDTPFQPGGGETVNETALGFTSTFSVKFTIVSLNADLSFTAVQTAVGLTDSWSMPGNWGKGFAGAVQATLNKETHRYELQTTAPVALTLDVAADCGGEGPAVGAVNLVEIQDIRNYFPGFSAELLSVVNDGVEVPFDNSKIKYGDIEGKGNFRIELHNIWGSGTAADPAFGGAVSVADNNCVTSLGFTASSVYTIGNFSGTLYTVPAGW